MYLNNSILSSSGISINEYGLLCLIFANKNEDNSEVIKENCNADYLKQLEERGLVQFTKPKNKQQTQYHCVRLTKEAQELLEMLETPEITDGDKKLFDYACQIYLSHEDEDRRIGNKKATLIYTAQFRQKLGLTLYEMYYLLELFLSEYEYSKILERCFFDKKKHPYGKFANHLSDAPLMQFYEDNKERVEKYWKLKIKEE